MKLEATGMKLEAISRSNEISGFRGDCSLNLEKYKKNNS
jgi:hypothetical protein